LKGKNFLHHVSGAPHMDGTPNDATLKMLRIKDSDSSTLSYNSNANHFPAVFGPNAQEYSQGGTFSIYANIKPTDVSVYRDSSSGSCSDETTCESCTKMGDQVTGEACDFGDGKCGGRSTFLSASEPVDACTSTSSWASDLYLMLGNGWDCVTSTDGTTLRQLLSHWTTEPSHLKWRPLETQCAEACYFANMQWAGWTGIYSLTMNADSTYPSSISTGHTYPLEIPSMYPLAIITVQPFFCEGFKFVEDSSCTFLETTKFTSLSKSGSSGAQCFIGLDNPNPCGLGTNDDRKWAQSSSGHYYFVTDQFGMLEYVQVGDDGPATCGQHKNVFADADWTTGKDEADAYMPNPALTCNDDTCKRCVDHMLTRSMVRGMLSSASDSEHLAACKMVSASTIKKQCDGETVRMDCPNGESVSIEAAFYGRQMDSKLCSNKGALSEKVVPTDETAKNYESCWLNVKSNVEAECDGKSSCSIAPSKDLAEGEECKELFSYMQVEYTCSGQVSFRSAL